MHQPVKKIDMHVHCVPELDLPRTSGTNYPLPADLRRMYDQIGIDRGVLMAPGRHMRPHEPARGISSV